MNIKQSILSMTLIFVVAMIWNGLFHVVLIAEYNELIIGLIRPEFSGKMILSILITGGIATVFVISYNKWRRTGTLTESLNHGLFFAVLAGILVNANQYLIFPIPGMLTGLWFLGGLVEFTLYSVTVWSIQRFGNSHRV